MSAGTKSVEDSIKIALDAADAATNVTDEFVRITNDYSAMEGKVKKMYRNATIIFVSSAAASLIAVLVASMMYYRTIETMETSNNTSLEALIIFAENVDKLAAATTALDVSVAEQEQLREATAAANEALAARRSGLGIRCAGGGQRCRVHRRYRTGRSTEGLVGSDQPWLLRQRGCKLVK